MNIPFLMRKILLPSRVTAQTLRDLCKQINEKYDTHFCVGVIVRPTKYFIYNDTVPYITYLTENITAREAYMFLDTYKATLEAAEALEYKQQQNKFISGESDYDC